MRQHLSEHPLEVAVVVKVDELALGDWLAVGVGAERLEEVLAEVDLLSLFDLFEAHGNRGRIDGLTVVAFEAAEKRQRRHVAGASECK
jgi:hypothetical protein